MPVPLSSRLSLTLWILFLACPLPGAEDIRVATARVEDDRSSESRMGSLAIELRLEGGAPADVKALRVKVKSARDNVGSVLNRPAPEGKTAEFEEFSPDRHPGPQVRLASPSREASSVDIAGEVELFIPSRDPQYDTEIRRVPGSARQADRERGAQGGPGRHHSALRGELQDPAAGEPSHEIPR